MLYSIKNRKVLEKLKKLVSLNNQVDDLRLQDKLGKQNFCHDLIKVLQPVTDTIKKTSEEKILQRP